jgi:hypothetical protein
MVDKIWYCRSRFRPGVPVNFKYRFDWQHKHPANARAYEGGSVEALENVTIFNMFPNGQAPFLNVRATFYRTRSIKMIDQNSS